ncbi:hypothetical protein OSB04_002258 [Centaurea solstitialis]|uniref:Reverse transcriptase domain-containing protein n=1 Tax=Centaurea solstitialis TaxID=347529 RepID=A0AA38UAG6_9ASTR|nr:hypothetical protein OSB04_002258 [Centaurea solstitialis]
MGFEDIFGDSIPQPAVSRKSVFERLSNDARLEHDDVVKSKMDFAAVVGKGTNDSLAFFPLENKATSSVRIPVELAKEVMKTHHTTLMGYFLGPRLHFPVVQGYVKTAWSKYGFVDAMMNNNGVYFFKFNDAGGCQQVIDSGPLMIRGVPMFLSLWDPLKGLSKPIHTTCPLWVKLHNIPLVAFNREGIGRIASALGVPKQMDACTSTMCDKAWGRPGFAKVLIDVWSVGELKREIEVVIPNLMGGEEAKVSIRVEYIWEPTQCSHCLVFGHKISTCAKAVADTKKKHIVQHVDNDGFVRVEKKQWKPKVVDIPSSSGIVKETVVTPVVDQVLVGLEKEVVDVDCGTDSGKGSIDTLMTDQNDKGKGADDMREDDVSRTVSSIVDEPILDSVISNIQAPVKPIRGILKNTNRYNPLLSVDTRTKDAGTKQGVKKGDTGVGKKISLEGGLCCWNIRGLNARIKQGEVREVIKNNGISFCALVETHVKSDMLSSVCNAVFGKWKWISNTVLSDTGTRILLAWDECVGDVMILECHAQFLHCFVKLRGGKDAFFITIVYGSNSPMHRKELWSGLRKAKVMLGSQPWTIMGDFNAMLFPHDGFGGTSRRNSSMDDFNACVEDIEVVDVGYSGVQYTWVQKPRGGEDGLMRKLDRIMANVEFFDRFHGSSVVFHPRGISDHAIGILEIQGRTRKRTAGFKFDNFIAEHPSFLEVVSKEWEVDVHGSFMHRILTHLKRLKQPLRQLRNGYGNLSRRVNQIRLELNSVQLACDMDPLNKLLLEDLAHLLVAFEKAKLDEDAFFRQRAKVRWIREGDCNTRFFHNVVKERKGRSFIREVQLADGSMMFDDDVGQAFVMHFRGFLGFVDQQVSPEMDLALFTNTVTFADSLYMIRPITDDEIKAALFSIGNDKAPGSDGFSSKFYKAAWNVIGKDFLIAIHNFFYNARLAKEINHTLLCLIPKVPNATRVSDFRPISCCSVLYKVISKVIADRMKPVLSSIISRSQSAFIPGRRITDNILMAHELVAGYQRDVGTPRCAFKIDLRKAYDTVDWRYLLAMLRNFGFHPVLCKWIDEMLSTSSFSVVVNGETYGFFKGARGLRQGDPISPYLFTIVMEGFSMLLKKCIQEANDFLYHQGCDEFEITHLCFADDLFVFTGGNLGSVEVLKRALERFRVISGLEPNISKSEVFFCNVTPENRQVILNSLPFRVGMFPIRYLGIPLSPVSLKVADFAPLVNKVKARIHDWKAKFLSFGGRKQLIISVLQSMQLYWMLIYILPSATIHELESLFRDFLWAQGETSKGKCKIAWDMVCKPINCGGLGFKRLACWNRALVTKHIWDIVCKRNSLWVSWIWRYRIMNTSFWTIRPRQNWPWIFRKILDVRESVRRFFIYQVGDGSSINAWEDRWFQQGPLSSLISYRRFHSLGFDASSVARDVILTCDGTWPIAWVQSNPTAFSTHVPIVDEHLQDRLYWEGVNGMAQFSVKDAWFSLSGVSPNLTWTKYVWFKGNIPKHAFCMWTACFKRLPTQDRIGLWKHDPPDMRCVFCQQVPDSHDHLFFMCPYALEVWQRVKREVHLYGFPNIWNQTMVLLEERRGPSKMIQKLALSATIYFIWRERNRRLFQGRSLASIQLFVQIRDVIMARVAWWRTKTCSYDRYPRPHWAQTNLGKFWAESRLLKHAARGRSPRTSGIRPPGLELGFTTISVGLPKGGYILGGAVDGIPVYQGSNQRGVNLKA